MLAGTGRARPEARPLLPPRPETTMGRELLLLRHAKSDWAGPTESDFERPLAGRGKKEAPKVGQWLRRQGLVPDRVVSSPAKRARQTTRRVCEGLGVDTAQVAWEPRVYEAQTGTLLAILADCPATARRVLLVGHNPGLETLLAHLWGDACVVPADGKLLPTATVAWLDLPDDWSALGYGCGSVRALTRPAEMEAG
jgi:phosphohistidine phosphatase